MKWRELIEDDTNRLSSARLVALSGGLTLSFSTLLLTIGSFWNSDMLATLSSLGPSLAGMAGVNYAANRWATTNTRRRIDDPDA